MKVVLKEIKDANGKVVFANVWIIVAPNNSSEMNAARLKLDDFISKYIGDRMHNIYIHSAEDTVSAVIVFDLDKCQEKFFDM